MEKQRNRTYQSTARRLVPTTLASLLARSHLVLLAADTLHDVLGALKANQVLLELLEGHVHGPRTLVGRRIVISRSSGVVLVFGRRRRGPFVAPVGDVEELAGEVAHVGVVGGLFWRIDTSRNPPLIVLRRPGSSGVGGATSAIGSES